MSSDTINAIELVENVEKETLVVDKEFAIEMWTFQQPENTHKNSQ